MHAIINTVSMSKPWPQSKVLLFNSYREAVSFAAQAIRKAHPREFDSLSDAKAIEEFQSSLLALEWFTIVRVTDKRFLGRKAIAR